MSTFSIILQSGLKAASELLLNVGVSGILEGIFPPFNPRRSPWLNLFEGSIEITLYLLIAGTASNSIAEMFIDTDLVRLPYGSLLMFWLLEGAVQKVMHFVDYISHMMNKKRVPVKPLEIPALGEDRTVGTIGDAVDTPNTDQSPGSSSSKMSSCGTSECS